MVGENDRFLENYIQEKATTGEDRIRRKLSAGEYWAQEMKDM